MGKKTRRRARDPEAAPADADGEVRDRAQPDGAVPACAVWQDHYEDLRCDFGIGVWDAWLKMLIPESDVDGVLTLAVSTSFYRDHIDATYKEGLQKTLGREIVIVQRDWTRDVTLVREIKAGMAERNAARQAGHPPAPEDTPNGSTPSE